MLRRLIAVLIAPIALIVAVLGSILGGIATPTEAASVGAVGAILLAMLRSGAAGLLMPVVLRTAQITSMIFLILIGATLFSLVFRGLGGDGMVERALTKLPGGVAGATLAVMAALFLLGFVMDAFEIIFVVVPIVAPVLLQMPGVDPVWLGIMMAVNLQTSYIHPAAWCDAVLFARRRAAGDIHATHLSWDYPLRTDSARDAAGALVRASAGHVAAAQAVRFLGHDPEKWTSGFPERSCPN